MGGAVEETGNHRNAAVLNIGADGVFLIQLALKVCSLGFIDLVINEILGESLRHELLRLIFLGSFSLRCYLVQFSIPCTWSRSLPD